MCRNGGEGGEGRTLVQKAKECNRTEHKQMAYLKSLSKKVWYHRAYTALVDRRTNRYLPLAASSHLQLRLITNEMRKRHFVFARICGRYDGRDAGCCCFWIDQYEHEVRHVLRCEKHTYLVWATRHTQRGTAGALGHPHHIFYLCFGSVKGLWEIRVWSFGAVYNTTFKRNISFFLFICVYVSFCVLPAATVTPPPWASAT